MLVALKYVDENNGDDQDVLLHALRQSPLSFCSGLPLDRTDHVHVEDRFTSASVHVSYSCQAKLVTPLERPAFAFNTYPFSESSTHRNEGKVMRDDDHRVSNRLCCTPHQGSSAPGIASAAAVQEPPTKIFAVGASDTETLGELSASLKNVVICRLC